MLQRHVLQLRKTRQKYLPVLRPDARANTLVDLHARGEIELLANQQAMIAGVAHGCAADCVRRGHTPFVYIADSRALGRRQRPGQAAIGGHIEHLALETRQLRSAAVVGKHQLAGADRA
ncbi:hypothetical protein D3C76_1008300 [compost metagenome]